ncbi:hydrogenase iron-sulfur subunit, partial [bacterium]
HIGFEEDRTLFSWVSASEGNIFADKAKEVTARIKKLGPRKKLLKNRDI